MAKSLAHEIAGQFTVAERFAARGHSLAEMRAVLFIALATMERESPRLLTISEVAEALEMSVSGTSRMLKQLLGEEFPLIKSEKGYMGNKLEVFFLSETGRKFIENILTFIRYGKNMKGMFSFDLSSFAQAKYIDRKGYNFAARKSWDPDTLIMITAPIDASLLSEISQWIKDQDRPFASMEQIKEGIKWTFEEKSNAVIFTMRWCTSREPS